MPKWGQTPEAMEEDRRFREEMQKMTSEERQMAKEKALEACEGKHYALARCYNSITLFTWDKACTAEHKAFWDCFKAERGNGKTLLQAYFVETEIREEEKNKARAEAAKKDAHVK